MSSRRKAKKIEKRGASSSTNVREQASTGSSNETRPKAGSPLASRVGSSKVAAASTAAASTGAWIGLKKLPMLLNKGAGAIGPLKAVVDEFIECMDICEEAAKGRDNFEALQCELEALFECLQQQFSRVTPPTVTISMECLCQSILEELSYVKEKRGRGTAKRYLEAEEDVDAVVACYRRIQAHLQRLSLNANLSTWKIVDEHATDARLDRLCPSLAACYNSRQAKGLKRGVCTPGTRVDVLDQAYHWAFNHPTGSVYWLNGMAGTGKTTIACSLCANLDAARHLGASFFCSRLLPECRDVNQIIPSIAYQLARFSRPFRFSLSRVLEKDRDVHTQMLETQLEALVIKPLVEVQDTLPEGIVVVIDALDECDDKESTGQILEILLANAPKMPIKFFIATRPEPEIRDQMKAQYGNRDILRLVLHELDKGIVQGDIVTYLKAALRPIEPSDSDITRLVERAGILFIYAATVARYIGYDNFGRNPRSRLEAILGISTTVGTHPYKEIDELYRVILEASIDDPELNDLERNDMTQVLHTVLCAREPLTISALSGLLCFGDPERVHAALRPLWSVLHVVETSELVTTLHASFPDYMFDSRRSRGYYCDPEAQNYLLARCCFDCIKDTKPQFNICGLESSHVRDDEIQDLSSRVEKAIPQELHYVCRYWASHLERSKDSSDLLELLESFLSVRLLLWMEIMNLTKCIDIGVGVIRQAEEWCVTQTCRDELKQLARDAWRFVAAFTSSPASQSTPHIYVSMLPCWPSSSHIAKYYIGCMRAPTAPQGSAIAQRQLDLLALWLMDGSVESVSWSPDGTRVGLVENRQIRILNAATGRAVISPLQLSSGYIQSIGFSPDSTCIVYGAEDGTIGVRDARTGQMRLGPLPGHTHAVNSVAFSPDNARIASGSSDKTIRIWNAQNGQKLLVLPQGRTGAVTSVAFSPDCTRVVSGCRDNTINVWDARNGQRVLGPLSGHTYMITSVAYSPDGTRIASGSSDKTIRVWNAQTGQAELSPLKGHIDVIKSVAFSPNGIYIVSGSSDKTVRVWDARNGKIVLGPLVGHNEPVTSVTFSPDSTRIISGSIDKTIRMWDTHYNQIVLASLEGHTGSVISVAFSPDGSRIVSGSSDETIRVWDARSGKMMLGPLERHSNLVLSITFSPDGHRILSGTSDKSIKSWDIQQEGGMPDPAVSTALSGRRVPIVHDTSRSLSAQEIDSPAEDSVTSVASSHNGVLIASGYDSGAIWLWTLLEDGQMATLKTMRCATLGKGLKLIMLGLLCEHTLPVTSVAFSFDDNQIASGSRDKTIRIWDVQSKQAVLGPLKGHTGPVTSVGFSPNGKYIISGSSDKTIRIWSAYSGEMVRGPLRGHSHPITSVIFSPDNTRVASGSSDNTIRVWDAQTGRTLFNALQGHTQAVRSISFSPDGTRIVSGSDDCTIRVWDARSSQPAAQFQISDRPAPIIEWRVKKDGWVVDCDSGQRLLVWLPSDLRAVLLDPRNILKIATKQSVGLNFIGAEIGEDWAKCYQVA